jgi:hypothetical protein
MFESTDSACNSEWVPSNTSCKSFKTAQLRIYLAMQNSYRWSQKCWHSVCITLPNLYKKLAKTYATCIQRLPNWTCDFKRTVYLCYCSLDVARQRPRIPKARTLPVINWTEYLNNMSGVLFTTGNRNASKRRSNLNKALGKCDGSRQNVGNCSTRILEDSLSPF